MGIFSFVSIYTNCSPTNFRSRTTGTETPIVQATDVPSVTPTTSLSSEISYSIKTDWEIYPEPPLPERPEVGAMNIDPTFGTPFVRVSADSDGPNCGTNYSYYPTLNKDNTNLFISCGNDTFVADLDADSISVTNKRKIPLTDGLLFEDAVWSHLKPSSFYIHNFGPKIYEVDVQTNAITLALDASEILSTTHYIWQMSVSADDRYFAFTKKKLSDYTISGYAVLERGSNQVILNIDTNQLDEVQIDKSGKFLLVKTGLESSWALDNVKNVYWNLETKLSVDLLGRGDRAAGHSDLGSGFVVGHENWDNSVLCRDFSKANLNYLDMPIVVPGAWDPKLSNAVSHYSMLAKNEGWVFVSSSDLSVVPGLMRNELTQVSTDGQKAIRRLLHHRSVPNSYSDMPRATISFDGRFLAFTSNWGNTGRRDLYIAKIPAAEPRAACARP